MLPETNQLIKEIEGLSDDEKEAVRKFIDYLRQGKASPFLSAVDEFIEKHPELLRRLAR